MYGAAATFYNLITGIVPENAIEREVHDTLVPPARLFGDIPAELSNAVMRALSTLPSQRHRTVNEFRDELTGKKVLAAESTPSEPDSTTMLSRSRSPLKRRSLRLGIGTVALALLTGLIGFVVIRDRLFQGAAPEDPGARAAPAMNTLPKPASDRKPGEVWTDPATGVELAWCPAGSFMMGSDALNDETPMHEVSFAQGFWMQTTEVTQALWKRVVGSKPWVAVRGGAHEVPDIDDCPGIYVTLYDAQLFANELNRRGGVGYHVPSEAEWEYACRAGSTGMFCFGDDESVLAEYAWYEETAANIGEKFVHRVRLKRPNAWGLYDMHGGVFEWCTDWYHSTYAAAPTDGSPWLTPPTSSQVNRGGCWASSAGSCRSANRNDYTPASFGSLVGFRVAKSDAPATERPPQPGS
ncbi:MAG: SUMF1/EgtB/PvdO family nonheme iron enzyme [Acidobacteriota bacterium]